MSTGTPGHRITGPNGLSPVTLRPPPLQGLLNGPQGGDNPPSTKRTTEFPEQDESRS